VQKKKIIFFQAHPDDLEFYCAHLLHYLAKKSKHKYEIKIASMTKGEFGTPPHGSDHFKGERLGKIRTKELYRAQKYHEITPKQIYFFGIMDGSVEFDKSAINLVKNYLESEDPDIVFAPEPINTYYRHSDHMNTGKIIYYIYDKIRTNKTPKLFFFTTLNANFYWPFRKRDILFAYKLIFTHKSQFWMMRLTPPLYKLTARSYGGHLKGWKYAEGYRRVYFREEKNKNEKLNILKRVFLILNVKVWSEKIIDYEI
jgi:LmbE family N-acetylglucosaminyl deacetylase